MINNYNIVKKLKKVNTCNTPLPQFKIPARPWDYLPAHYLALPNLQENKF